MDDRPTAIAVDNGQARIDVVVGGTAHEIAALAEFVAAQSLGELTGGGIVQLAL
jgi:hypothetical protein